MLIFLIFAVIMYPLLKRKNKMKKMLSMLFSVLFVGLYASTASAEHYGIPTVGQERKEVVWHCTNIDDARIYVTERAEAESYMHWIFILREIVEQDSCMMGEIEYVVDEVVETISGLEVKSRAFGEPIPHYIIKSDGHFLVTY